MVSRLFGGAVNAGTAVGNIVVNATGVATGVSQASGHLRGFSLEAIAMVRGFRAISDIGLGIGLGIGAGLAVAVNEFAKFEKALRNVSSLGLDAGQTFDQLKNSVLQLSSRTAIAPTELANALYEIRQAGFSASDSLLILGAAADAANAGLTDAKVAADLISSVILAYGFAARDAARISNILFSTVVVGKVTFEDLARTMGFVLPTAHAMGVSLEELGASFASLTNQGLSVRAAGNSINSLLNSLIKPTKALSAAFAQNGIESGQMLIATRGLGGAIEYLDQISGQNVSTLQKLLGNQRSTRAELFLAANGAAEYTKALNANNAAQEGVGATAKVLVEQQKAVAFQFKQTRNELTIAAIQIGEVLAPAAVQLAGAVRTIAQALNGIDPAFRSVIVNGLAFIAIMGLFVGVTGRVLASIIRFSESIRLLRLGISQSNAAMVAAGPAGTQAAAGMNAAAAGANTAALSFGRLLKFAGRTVAFAVVLTALFDFTKLALGKPGDNAFLKAARGLDRGLAFAIDKIGFDETADRINENLDRKLAASKAADVAVKLGLDVDSSAFSAATGEFDILIGKLRLSASEIDQIARDSGKSVQDVLVQLSESQGISTDQIKAIQATDEALQDQNSTLQETSAIGKTAAQTYENLTSQIDSLGKKVSETEQRFIDAIGTGLTLPLTPSPDEFKAFADAFDKAVSSVLASVGKLSSTDVSDPLAFLQSQFGLVGNSALGAILKLERLGVVDIFGGADQSVLAMVADLNKWSERIAEVDARIQNNTEDISMWAGRISLVSDLFGSNQETLDEWIAKYDEGKITFEEFTQGLETGNIVNFDLLNTLLNEGKLTQDEYNAAVEAGIHILERSAGAKHDEAAEQALLLPLLDEYISKHDDANRRVNELSDEQRLLAGLLQDTTVQQALATVQTVAYLAAIGQIPPEKATEVIMDLAGSDERIHAVLDLLDLIPDPVDIRVEAQIDEAQQKLHEIQVERDALIQRRALLLVQPQTNETREELGNINDQLGFLTDEEKTVKLAIDTGDFSNPIFQAESQIDGIEGDHVVGIDGSAIPAEIAFINDLLDEAIQRKRELPPFLSKAQANEQIQVIDAEIDQLRQKLSDAAQGKITLDQTEIRETEERIEALGNKKIEILGSIDSDGSMAAAAIALEAQIRSLQQQRLDILATIEKEDATEGLNSLEEARRRLVETQEQISLLPPSPENEQSLAIIISLINQIDAVKARADVGLDTGDTLGLLQEIAGHLGEIANPIDLTITADTNIVQQQLDAVIARRNAVVDELNAISDAATLGDPDAVSRTEELLRELSALQGQEEVLQIVLNPGVFQTQIRDIEGQISDLQEKRLAIQTGLEPPPDGQTINEALEEIDTRIEALNFNRIRIQTVLDQAEAAGLIDAAGNVLDPITIPVRTPNARQAFKELEDVDGIRKRITKEGDLILRADSTQAVAEFERVNNLSLITRPDIRIVVNGEEVTALQVRVDNLFDIINERTTASYKVFIEGDAKNAVDAADLAGQNADSVAKVYTAFFNADTTTFQEQVEFVLSLLDILGINTTNATGEIGIEFKSNPGDALAVIQAINNDINTKLLTPDFLIHLDANADGFLTAAELATASAEGLTEDPWVATFIADTENAENKFKTVDGLLQAFIRGPNEVHIEVDSAEAAQKFVDLNAETLAGKHIVVRIRDEATGKLRTLDEFDVPPKDVEFKPVVDDASKVTAQTELDNITTEGDKTVTTTVAAETKGQEEVKNLRDDIKTVTDQDGKIITIVATTEESALEFANEHIDALAKTVGIVIEANGTQVFTTLDEIRLDAATPINVPIIGNLLAAASTPAITPAIQPIDADTTAADQKVAGLKTRINFPDPRPKMPVDVDTSTIEAEDLTEKGAGTAQTFVDGFIQIFGGATTVALSVARVFSANISAGMSTGLNQAIINAATGRNNILNEFNRGAGAAFAGGRSVGANFAIGVAVGIAANAAAAYANAFALGQGIIQSAQNAIQSSSPSQKGILLGKTFPQGVAIGIRSAAGQAIDEARLLAEQVSSEFESKTRPFTVSSIFERETDPLAASHFLPRSSFNESQALSSNVFNRGGSSVTISAPISISGVSDPEEAADLAITKLHRSFERISSGGG